MASSRPVKLDIKQLALRCVWRPCEGHRPGPWPDLTGGMEGVTALKAKYPKQMWKKKAFDSSKKTQSLWRLAVGRPLARCRLQRTCDTSHISISWWPALGQTQPCTKDLGDLGDCKACNNLLTWLCQEKGSFNIYMCWEYQVTPATNFQEFSLYIQD